MMGAGPAMENNRRRAPPNPSLEDPDSSNLEGAGLSLRHDWMSYRRMASASATCLTAASSSEVNGSATSLSMSICPRIRLPRRISTTSSERVHTLQAR